MDSEIAADFSPWLRIYQSGRVERLDGETIVPPSLTPQNGVVSKDVVYSTHNNLSLRIFLPHQITQSNQKLPLLVYFHGGGFILETAFSPTYHAFVSSAVSAADCIAVSVDYRRAPEHPIPIPYEDSWTALKWIFTHVSGSGQEHWLNQQADFTKVFLAGDSAGANITHHMTIKAGKEKLTSLHIPVDPIIHGIILIHPFFWGKTPIDELETKDVKVRTNLEKLWESASPNSKDGADDPLINVVGTESCDFSGLCCGKVLVMVAGNDPSVRRCWCYAAKLEKSSWKGKVEVFETKDEEHVFHLRDPNTENALKLLNKFADFLKG